MNVSCGDMEESLGGNAHDMNMPGTGPALEAGVSCYLPTSGCSIGLVLRTDKISVFTYMLLEWLQKHEMQARSLDAVYRVGVPGRSASACQFEDVSSRMVEMAYHSLGPHPCERSDSPSTR